MKVKDGFVLRDVAGQAVVIATGAASETFHGMVKLNATGAVIWRAVAEGRTAEEAAERLAGQFDVPVEQVKADVDGFIEKMRAEGFLA